MYQAPVLRPLPGQEIKTLDGVYVTKEGDIFHSNARFNQLEQENLELVAANRALLKQGKSN